METIESLGIGGATLRQDSDCFKLGTDGVLLAGFSKIKKNALILELGCGIGGIPVLIAAQHETAHIYGVEIGEKPAVLAKRNAEENGYQDRITIKEADIRTVGELLPNKKFDLILCNPPYAKKESGIKSPNALRQTARFEECCTLEDVTNAAIKNLKFGGTLTLCYRPDRLVDLFCALRSSNFEPKRLQFVRYSESHAPSLVLVESRLGGNCSLKTERDLILCKTPSTSLQHP